VKKSFEVVIAGAGMVGLTAAALLATNGQRHRMTLRVIDAGVRPRFDPDADMALRVSALSAGSAATFRKLQVWDRIVAGRACPFREMIVWDGSRPPAGPDTLRFDAAEFAVPELGHIVENIVVQEALLVLLDRLGVEIRFDAALADLHALEGRCIIELENGGSLEADLLVGADGSNSIVRRCARIAATSWQYPQSAFVTHLVPAEPHRNTAWQRFLPDGPLALLPLWDGRVSVVWSTAPAVSAVAMEASDAALGRQVTDASGGILGALTAGGPRASFPLRSRYASAYVKPGVALIGDAAHSIHPLAGQGANLGIADAAQLSRVVCAAVADGDNPGDWPVLRRYERTRKGANQSMLYFVDGLNGLFSSPTRPVAALRSAGMRLFNRSGPLRRRVVATALGVIDSE
jgi:2-octaprenylphenol hydroxylase